LTERQRLPVLHWCCRRASTIWSFTSIGGNNPSSV
jgi:hypothetical protein